MAPDRAAQGLTEGWLAHRLTGAVSAGGLLCDAIMNDVSIYADQDTADEPDIPLRCGRQADPDAVDGIDPTLVAKILLRTTQGRDQAVLAGP